MRRVAAAVGLACAGAAYCAESPDEVVARVRDAALLHLEQRAERESWVDPEFELAVVPGEAPVQGCDGAVTVEPADTRRPARMRFVASCADRWRRGFVVRADVSARVVVAAAPVPAGRPIGDADLALERRSLRGADDALGDPRDALGLSSRRSLRSGDVVRRAALVAPTVVRRGDAVRIVARREGIEATSAGEALDAGARGDVVRVRNSGTGKVIRARVTEAGVVEPAGR